MYRLISFLAGLQNQFINFLRFTVFLVMVWIGGLKAFQYEAQGIVPFVANSPVMSFFYSKKAPEYQQYKNPEGKTIQKNVDWHHVNGTYLFSYGLGAVIVGIGLCVLLGIWFPKIGVLSGILTFGMSLVTLSFLITTPETFVSNLGGDFPTPYFGFPYLSASGRLVIKDIIMLGSGLIFVADSAKRIMLSISR